jgi:hypothetical protein
MHNEERLVKAAEVIAISIAHVAATWIAQNYNHLRANYLLDQIEPKMEWKMQRYVQ